MRVEIVDCETDGFLDEMTKLHMIQIGSADGDDVTIYLSVEAAQDFEGKLPEDLGADVRPLAEGIERLLRADQLVFHNGFGFDLWAINRFYPGTVDPERVFDTMVASRLVDPEADSTRLETLGREMGIPKGEFSGDFRTVTVDMLRYAAQDIVVTRAVYQKCRKALKEWGVWDDPARPNVIDTEMRFAYLMALQEKNGFLLDVKAAQELEAEFRGELAAKTAELRKVFKPIWVPTEKTPFVPKADNRRMGYVAGAELTKVELQEFSPSSRRQVAARLERLGWKPKKFNKDGTPQIDDAILSQLPYPEAGVLADWYAVKKKLEQIADGKSAWLKWVKPDGRVHGRVNTVGCAPGRCSHSSPNMAQVNKKDKRMRGVWGPRPGWVLVGCDGEGLQARMLAHYVARYDEGTYAKRVSEGKKEDKSDVHSVNLRELPFLNAAFSADKATFSKARDGAKTCLYCVLFGGQDPKLGKTVKEACKDAGVPIPRVPDRDLGGMARVALFRAIQGFEKLYGAIQKAARRGYLTGPDKRRIPIRSKHSALVFLMQAGEAAVMKLAAVIFFFERARARGWQHGVDFAFAANVHDEVQIEARPEIADDLGKEFAQCITEAGIRLGLRCPLKGDYSVGQNWAETH